MTTLPATLVEAEALQFARAWIADCLGHNNPVLEVIDAARQERGRALFRAAMKRSALHHPFMMAEIVYFARHGFEIAHLTLKELIAERTDRGEPLGAVLGSYLIETIHQRLPRRGRTKEQFFFQNLAIYILIEAVMERFGLKATRNQTARRRPS